MKQVAPTGITFQSVTFAGMTIPLMLLWYRLDPSRVYEVVYGYVNQRGEFVWGPGVSVTGIPQFPLTLVMDGRLVGLVYERE